VYDNSTVEFDDVDGHNATEEEHLSPFDHPVTLLGPNSEPLNFFITYDWANKIECLSLASLFNLV